MKSLSIKQRNFLETGLLPYVAELGYDSTIHIIHRPKDFTSAIQKVMREGEYTLKQKFMLQRLWRIWTGNEK